MIVKIFVQVLCMHLVVVGLNLQGTDWDKSVRRLHRDCMTIVRCSQGNQSKQRTMRPTVLHQVLLKGTTTTHREMPQTVLHDVFLTRRTTTRRTIRRPTTTIRYIKLRNSSQNVPPHGPVEVDVSRRRIHSPGERKAELSITTTPTLQEVAMNISMMGPLHNKTYHGPVEVDVSRGRIHSPGERKAELSITTTPTLQEAAMNISMMGPLHNKTYHGRHDHNYWHDDYLHVLYDHCARRIGLKKCIESLYWSEQALCYMIQANKTYTGSIQKYPYIFEYFDYYNLDIQDLSCKAIYTGLTMPAYTVMYVICGLGLLGNGLSILTIYTADNQLTSTSIYLIALALSDSVYLLYNIAMFEQRNIYMREIGDNVVSSISAWFLVVITVERFLSIYNPYKVQDHCYPRSAKMYVAIVLYVLSAIHTTMYLAGAYGDSIGSSELFDEYIDIHHIDIRSKQLAVMVFVLVFGGPFLLILTLNIAIIRILYKAAKQRRGMSKSDWDKEKKITRTLAIVTIAYIVFIGPYYTIEILFAFTDYPFFFDDSHGPGLAREYMEILKIMNYCINFLIYTLCGSKYRESFLTLLKRTRCKHHTHVV